MFTIVINKLDNSSNHGCLLNAAAQNVVFGVVLVHPHLNNSLFIDCDMLLLDLKEANHFAKDLKPPQALVVHMQTVWKRDILNIGKADGGLFDKQSITVRS